MSKNIQKQIAEMETRCNQLEGLQKLFNKAVINEFNMDTKKIHSLIEKNDEKQTLFEREIANFFDLKASKDYSDFLTIFCTESSKNYFQKKKVEINNSDAEQG